MGDETVEEDVSAQANVDVPKKKSKSTKSVEENSSTSKKKTKKKDKESKKKPKKTDAASSTDEDKNQLHSRTTGSHLNITTSIKNTVASGKEHSVENASQRKLRGTKARENSREKTKGVAAVGADDSKHRKSTIMKKENKMRLKHEALSNEVSSEESSVEISDQSSSDMEDEREKRTETGRPGRHRGLGRVVGKSRSAGQLERDAQAQYLKRIMGDSTDEYGDSDEIETVQNARRPPRTRRSDDKPRVKSSSVGALERHKHDQFSQKTNRSNFLKPRRISVGAMKAKEHVERSVKESTLHLVQPDIKLAIPRVRSAGALNAKRSDQSPRRKAGSDRSPSIPSREPKKDPLVSPTGRKIQSDRGLRKLENLKVEDSTGPDTSDDSSVERKPIVPLPKDLLSNRKWKESKDSDQIPSLTKVLYARNMSPSSLAFGKHDGGNEMWQEPVRDNSFDRDSEKARKADRKAKRDKGRATPKKVASLPAAAVAADLFNPKTNKDPSKMSQNLKALLPPGAIKNDKEDRKQSATN